MKTLRQSALSKFAEGITTLGEVLRVSSSDQ
jgi:type II secretory ATPase GspE/PulE/Tfp pilus assembly ATPase PilB-like protein